MSHSSAVLPITARGRAGAATIAWIASEAVVSQCLPVPPVARRKWQKMLPWLLEERLLQPAAELELNHGARQEDGCVPLLAATREQVDAWRSEAGAAQLVPDFFALPWQPGAVSLAQVGERWLLRYGRWQGAAGPAAWMLALLEQRLLEPDTRVLVVGQDALLPPSLASRASRLPTRLFESPPDTWLALADCGRASTGFGWPARAAVLLLGLALLLGTGLGWQHSRQTLTQAQHIEQQLQAAYRQLFGEPYDYAMADFQRVVSRRLSGGEAPRPWRQFEDAVRRAQVALAACPECRLQRLQLRNDRLQWQISGAGEETLGPAAREAGLALRRTGDAWQLEFALTEVAP